MRKLTVEVMSDLYEGELKIGKLLARKPVKDQIEVNSLLKLQK